MYLVICFIGCWGSVFLLAEMKVMPSSVPVRVKKGDLSMINYLPDNHIACNFDCFCKMWTFFVDPEKN